MPTCRSVRDSNPAVTVSQHLHRIGTLRGIVEKGERERSVDDAIDRLNLGAVRDRKVRQLSGGVQRRLAFAQCLIGSAEVLILDEPTAGLDVEQRATLRQILGSLSRQGTAILLATHQPEDLVSIASKVIVIQSGEVVFDGAPADLTDRAAGRVWISSDAPEGSMSWPTADGRFRVLGPLEGDQAVTPTLEDGYLSLLGITQSNAGE